MRWWARFGPILQNAVFQGSVIKRSKDSRKAPVKWIYLEKSLGILCSFTVTWSHRVKNGTNGNVQQKFINSFFSIALWEGKKWWWWGGDASQFQGKIDARTSFSAHKDEWPVAIAIWKWQSQIVSISEIFLKAGRSCPDGNAHASLFCRIYARILLPRKGFIYFSPLKFYYLRGKNLYWVVNECSTWVCSCITF